MEELQTKIQAMDAQLHLTPATTSTYTDIADQDEASCKQ
jgi:hypothetical protein